MPLRSFEEVSSALNFTSEGLQLVGGCDLYTTKSAGSDKKLYKQLERGLDAQQEGVLRVAASLAPRQAERFARTCNLAQSSPFGTLSQSSARRAFSYMVATLNASHPDYDFGHLRPSDFSRERRVRDVQRSVDANVYAAQAARRLPRGGARTPGGSEMWGPRMWEAVEAEMRLRQCEAYSYRPEENPFDDEQTALWSLHYFFFNKQLKRVCYLYVRALTPAVESAEDDGDSSLAIEDLVAAVNDDDSDYGYETRRGGDDDDDDEEEGGYASAAKRTRPQSADFSARKRARYWLGDKADALEREWAAADHPDDSTDEHHEAAAAAKPGDEGKGERHNDGELREEMAARGRSLSSSNLSEEQAAKARRALVRRSRRARGGKGADVAQAVQA